MRPILSLWIAACKRETGTSLRVLGCILTGAATLAQYGCGSATRQIFPAALTATRSVTPPGQSEPAPINTGKIQSEISQLTGEINGLVSAGSLTLAQGAAITAGLDAASKALSRNEPDCAEAQRCLDRAFDKAFAALAGGSLADPAVTTRLLHDFNVLTAVLRDGIGGVAFQAK